jgi:precorrin-8X/cobalt-precorrin-8 methylmutase
MTDSSLMHPIMVQSFAAIDQEIGDHRFNAAEYAVVRRVIHSTADFEFKHLIHFSPRAIAQGTQALAQGVPIITDVTMVKQGIASMVARTFKNPLIAAIDQARTITVPEHQTRTAAGMLHCWQQHPAAIFVIGNAPTALMALCDRISAASTPSIRPALIIGAPVGFISVVESKQQLAQTEVEQIRIDGRKGGSAAAAAMLNALLTLAWEQQSVNPATSASS